jgi:hypothetical protein
MKGFPATTVLLRRKLRTQPAYPPAEGERMGLANRLAATAAGRTASIAGEATRARTAGQTVFSAELRGPAESWAQMIESIEASGWQLTHWSVAVDSSVVGGKMAYPVFQLR